MRSNHIAAAVVVSLSCTLLNASCVQSRSGAPEADGAGGGAPVIETMDDGDPFGSDPDVGGGIGSGSPVRDPETDLSSAHNPYYPPPSGPAEPAECGFTYRLCCLMKHAPPLARDAFCRSQPDYEIRNACFSHTHDSSIKWQNWCYDTFCNE
jgi:hypothetical protein